MKYFLLICCFLLLGCTDRTKDIRANTIVDFAIEKACNGNCDNAKIDFTFRDVCYISHRDNGAYQLERIISDSTGVTRDVLTNNDFKRFKNDTLVVLADSTATKYTNSVNSVHYFAQLPYGLNAPAVIKKYLGEKRVKGENYHKVGVSFLEDGGGTDFDDTFVYWVNAVTFTVDYLAYRYAVDGGGIRFREAYNPRVVEGIRFVDYNNYKPKTLDIELEELDSLFEQSKLVLLSKIETEAVGVELHD